MKRMASGDETTLRSSTPLDDEAPPLERVRLFIALIFLRHAGAVTLRQRVMDLHIASFETILTIERTFGADLRADASRISRERYELRQPQAAERFRPADALADDEAAGSGDAGG